MSYSKEQLIQKARAEGLFSRSVIDVLYANVENGAFYYRKPGYKVVSISREEVEQPVHVEEQIESVEDNIERDVEQIEQVLEGPKKRGSKSKTQ